MCPDSYGPTRAATLAQADPVRNSHVMRFAYPVHMDKRSKIRAIATRLVGSALAVCLLFDHSALAARHHPSSSAKTVAFGDVLRTQTLARVVLSHRHPLSLHERRNSRRLTVTTLVRGMASRITLAGTGLFSVPAFAGQTAAATSDTISLPTFLGIPPVVVAYVIASLFALRDLRPTVKRVTLPADVALHSGMGFYSELTFAFYRPAALVLSGMLVLRSYIQASGDADPIGGLVQSFFFSFVSNLYTRWTLKTALDQVTEKSRFLELADEQIRKLGETAKDVKIRAWGYKLAFVDGKLRPELVLWLDEPYFLRWFGLLLPWPIFVVPTDDWRSFGKELKKSVPSNKSQGLSPASRPAAVSKVFHSPALFPWVGARITLSKVMLFLGSTFILRSEEVNQSIHQASAFGGKVFLALGDLSIVPLDVTNLLSMVITGCFLFVPKLRQRVPAQALIFVHGVFVYSTGLVLLNLFVYLFEIVGKRLALLVLFSAGVLGATVPGIIDLFYKRHVQLDLTKSGAAAIKVIRQTVSLIYAMSALNLAAYLVVALQVINPVPALFPFFPLIMGFVLFYDLWALLGLWRLTRDLQAMGNLTTLIKDDLKLLDFTAEELKPKALGISLLLGKGLRGFQDEPDALRWVGIFFPFGVFIVPTDNWRPLSDRLSALMKRFATSASGSGTARNRLAGLSA
jgi:hypothetical protein